MKRLLSLVLIVASVVVLATFISDSAVAHEGIYVTTTAGEEATDIVNGRIVSTTSVELDGDAFRVSEIEVMSQLKGSLTGTIFVETPGGERSDGTVVFVSHTPRLEPGELVQLALSPKGDPARAQLAAVMGAPDTVYSIVNGTEGAYGLLPDGVGRAQAVGDYVLSCASWPDFAPPVGFRVNTANSGVSPAGTIAAVKRAFALWEDDLASDIDFEYQGTSSKVGLDFNDGHSTISWVNSSDGWLAQASWTMTAHPENCGDILDFDVRMNRSYSWSNGAASGRYDIATVVGHEVGHGIGFMHAPSWSEIMYFQITEGTARGLGPGDSSGAAYLYPTVGPPQIMSPSDGAALCSGDVVSWSGGSGNFWVAVGVPGERNRFMSAGAGTNRSIVVSGIPSTSETLVTLMQRRAGEPAYSVVADQSQSACN